MANNEPKTLTIEDAQIIYRNFEGKEGPFNPKGIRGFSVVIPDEKYARMLEKDGWNIKFKDPREEGDDPLIHLPVAVSYKYRPPRIVLMTSRAKTSLNEETVETLDYADIEKVDLIVNASPWQVQEKSGIKAYLKTMFVSVREDFLERKYAMNEASGEIPEGE